MNSSPSRHCLALHGRIDLEQVLKLDDPPAHTTQLLVDLREADHCTPEARRALVDRQARWSRQGLRTAWLSDRPVLRGVALWVLHQSSDTEGRAVGSPDQADRWLASAGSRTSISIARLRRTS